MLKDYKAGFASISPSDYLRLYRESKEFIDKLQKTIIRILLKTVVGMLGKIPPEPSQHRHTCNTRREWERTFHLTGDTIPFPSIIEEGFKRSIWKALHVSPRVWGIQKVAPHSTDSKEMWLAGWSDSREKTCYVRLVCTFRVCWGKA